MKKVVVSILILISMVGLLRAQYINTDSLVIVPGEASPMLLWKFDSLLLNSPETILGSGLDYVFNQNIPAGHLLSRFFMPGTGKVISRYGLRSGRMHTGTDIKMSKGDTIYAAFDGRVTRSYYYYGYGNMVVLDHGSNLESYYAHLSAFLVKSGELVRTGDPVGLAGATGRATTSHLHFEIRENGRSYDPELVFDFEKQGIREIVTLVDNLSDLQKQLKPFGYSVNEPTPQNYRVRNGDSLWKISRRYRTSITALCNLNNLTENSVLQVGQVLQLF